MVVTFNPADAKALADKGAKPGSRNFVSLPDTNPRIMDHVLQGMEHAL